MSFAPGMVSSFSQRKRLSTGKRSREACQKQNCSKETRKARFLRLVFLTRSSSADHDMAVLTARRFADLEPRTAALKQDPEHGCTPAHECSWIPAGIAVTVAP